MGSLKSPRTTFYRSSIDTIAVNCLVFEKIAFFFAFWRQTNEQMDSIDALSRSRYRKRRLNNVRRFHQNDTDAVYKVSSKLDDFSLRYVDLTIFKMAAVRHLGF